MGNWIISPSQGVVNNNDGSFILPCSNTDVDYRVTYVEETCSSNTVTYTYVSSGGCANCPTSFTSGTISLVASTLPAEAASSKLLGYATKTTEYTAYTFSSSNTSMINNIAIGTSIAPNVFAITGTVYENTSSYGRSSTITVNAKGPNLPSTGCNDTFTLGQEAGGGGGSCPVSGDIISPQVVDAAGSHSTPIMRVKKDSTYTGYSFTSSDTSIINPSGILTPTINDWYLVMANVAANTENLRRTIPVTVKMSGTTTPSTGCNYTVDVIQEGSCATIEQPFYLGRINNNKISGDSQTSVGIAYVNPTSPYASWIAAFGTGTGNFVRNLTITNESGGPGGSKRVTVDIDENNTGADRTFDVVFTGTKTDGGICSKTLEFTQAPATTLTCTCDDLIINGTEEQAQNIKVRIGNSTNDHIDISIGNVSITTQRGTKIVNFDSTLIPGNATTRVVDFTGYEGDVSQVKVVINGVETTINKNCSTIDFVSFWNTSNTDDCGKLLNGNTLSIIIY